MRKVTGGDLGEGRARISVVLTRLHPCHINVSGGGGFNRFAHSAGPGTVVQVLLRLVVRSLAANLQDVSSGLLGFEAWPASFHGCSYGGLLRICMMSRAVCKVLKLGLLACMVARTVACCEFA